MLSFFKVAQMSCDDSKDTHRVTQSQQIGMMDGKMSVDQQVDILALTDCPEQAMKTGNLYTCTWCCLIFANSMLLEGHIDKMHNEKCWKLLEHQVFSEASAEHEGRTPVAAGKKRRGVSVFSKKRRDRKPQVTDDEDSADSMESHKELMDLCAAVCGYEANIEDGNFSRVSETVCSVDQNEGAEIWDKGAENHNRGAETWNEGAEKWNEVAEAWDNLERKDIPPVKKKRRNGRRYKCDVCDVTFTRSSNLQNHKRAHTGEKPYKCDFCGVQFTRGSNLHIHLRIHTGDKPYKCEVCGLCCARADRLREHMIVHVGDKPFKCDVCGIGFTRSRNLQGHMRKHTGEKPYICDICKAGFIRSSSLHEHKVMHTGTKPYKCDMCDKRFLRITHLREHVRIHTGEKPFSCGICGMGFSRHYTLRGHMKTHA